MEEKIINDILDKGLIFRIHKELVQPSDRKIDNTIEKWAKDQNRHYFNKSIQMASKHKVFHAASHQEKSN